MRLAARTSTYALWSAAARGAHVNGDHEAERRYRNVARMLRGRPPIVRLDRCIDGTRRHG